MASYQNLKAWQHAKLLAVGCLKIARTFPADEQMRGLADQLRRAATSAALNIAEGSNKGSNREHRRFLEMARTSLDEVRAILELAGEADYVRPDVLAALTDRCDEAGRTLFGLIRAINLRLDAGEVERVRRPGTARENRSEPAA